MRARTAICCAAAALAAAPAAGARAPVESRAGQAVAPVRPAGQQQDGRLVTRVRAPGDGRFFGTALFERRDVPVYPAGTVAECFAYGTTAGLARTPLDHFGMTCRPGGSVALNAGAAAHDPRAGAITADRYRQLRAAGRRLPGVTLVAGRVRAGVRRIEIRGAGRTRTIRAHGGGFAIAYEGWLERTTLRLRAGGDSRIVRFGEAGLFRHADGTEAVLPPEIRAR